jgi:hypothetical protein
MTARLGWSILGVSVLLVLTGLVVATAPREDTITEPFEVHGGMGETITSRALVVEPIALALTERLDIVYRDDVGDTTTDGVWVVLDTRVTGRVGSPTLSYSELRIGGTSYRLSEVLPAPSLLTLSYGAGVPEEGTLVFELPRSALEAPGSSAASIIIRPQLDSQLDLLPVIDVDLTELEVQPSVRVDEVTVADPR